MKFRRRSIYLNVAEHLRMKCSSDNVYKEEIKLMKFFFYRRYFALYWLKGYFNWPGTALFHFGAVLPTCSVSFYLPSAFLYTGFRHFSAILGLGSRNLPYHAYVWLPLGINFPLIQIPGSSNAKQVLKS